MEPAVLNFLLAIFSLLVGLACGQDDLTTICMWYDFRAASIRGKLVIDGGNMWMSTGSRSWFYTGNSSTPQSILYELDYSTPFEPATSNLTEIFTDVIEGGIREVVPFYSGYMFADAFEFYTFGGLVQAEVVIPPPASYAFGYELFEDIPGVGIPELGANPLTLPPGITRYTTNGAGVNVPSEKLGFYFSGMTSNESTYDHDGITGWTALDQLITVDLNTFGAPVFHNNSFNNPSVLPRANAELVWIPVGTRGTLLAIGGIINPEELFGDTLTPNQISESEQTSPTFMQQISIFDVDTGVWYSQEATGLFPTQLAKFCSVVVNQTNPETNSMAYDVFLYGGYNGLEGAGISSPTPPSDEVWVLSVPSFTWTRVYPGEGAGRYGHYCTNPYPEQMFVIGGASQEGTCLTGDQTIVQIFNLNELQWQTKYDPTNYSNTGYERPSAVANAIKAQPTAAWNDSAIGTLFSQAYTGPSIISYAPYTPNPIHHSHIPVGAIAGGVAGCICLVVLILAVWWYRRKHSKPPTEGDISEVQPYEQVSRWQRGVAKTDPSVTTTEVEEGSAVNPNTGGYYKPAHEALGDTRFYNPTPSSPPTRPGGFAEAGGGTRRISAGQITTPRSPHSGNTDAQEVEGEEKYEMDVLASKRVAGDRQLFRNHPMYPLSVSDGDGRSQASGPSYSGPSHSHSQSSQAGEAARLVPSPYVIARPVSGTVEDVELPAATSSYWNQNQNQNQRARPLSGTTDNTELPASPVQTRPTHIQLHHRSISSSLPQVSPPLSLERTPENDLDALEAFHTGSPPPFRPAHTRNLSSLSSGINQLPTPKEEISAEERARQSRLLERLSPAEGGTPVGEERNPLMNTNDNLDEITRLESGAVIVGEDVYSPSSYSKGSTLIGTRSPATVSRKPVAGLGLVGTVERAFEKDHETGEGKSTF